jgi:D-alanyl-D-alanine carboxypeptidase
MLDGAARERYRGTVRRVAVALGLVLALAAWPATAAARLDARTAAPPSLRQLAKGIVAVGSPGAVVLVHDARGTRAGTAGYASLRTKERLGANHVFRVGSITKTFVSVVVVQLAAEGVLRLDDPVEKWLPGVVPNGQAITLRQLLNHTSGIYNYTDDSALIQELVRNPLRVWTPAALIELANAHAPLFTPGSRWSYSNTGYLLLGLVVERATGQPLAEELRRRIFAPLGLPRTSFPSVPALAPPFAHGYLPPGGIVRTPGGRPVDVTLWSPSWAWAAGALVSTAGDLARFYGALLGGELLTPEALREVKTTVPILGGTEWYGLGLSRTPFRCAAAWGHGGSVPGYTSLAFSSEDGSRQAVVLVNTSIGNSRLAFRFETALTSAFCR